MKQLDHRSFVHQHLERAWVKRKQIEGAINPNACRIFSGDTEGIQGLNIDLFVSGSFIQAWVIWTQKKQNPIAHTSGQLDSIIKEAIVEFFLEKKVSGAALLERPSSGQFRWSHLFGNLEQELWVNEGPCQFLVQFKDIQHSGLFLDHRPLRRFLSEAMAGKTVLNTFAYTGSLSVAAAAGKASKVTTVDLSKPTLEWAKKNWNSNLCTRDSESEFWVEDYFEVMPRFIKKGRKFNVVILDPPSFSRSASGVFSTQKDLGRLHDLAFKVLQPQGLLISSINSEQVSAQEFKKQIESSARQNNVTLNELMDCQMPPDFPVKLGTQRYLKGGIFQLV